MLSIGRTIFLHPLKPALIKCIIDSFYFPQQGAFFQKDLWLEKLKKPVILTIS